MQTSKNMDTIWRILNIRSEPQILWKVSRPEQMSMSLQRGALRECINYDMDHDEGIKMVTSQWLLTTSLKLASVDEDDGYGSNSKNSDRLDFPSCIDRKLRLWSDCSLLDQNRLHPCIQFQCATQSFPATVPHQQTQETISYAKLVRNFWCGVWLLQICSLCVWKFLNVLLGLCARSSWASKFQQWIQWK